MVGFGSVACYAISACVLTGELNDLTNHRRSCSCGCDSGIDGAGHFTHISAAGQDRRPSATSAPVFLRWPLPASGKAYSTIDGARLWKYVREHGEIAERYRQQGHPQFWGIIAGTPGDAEEAQWLLGKYNQIGLTDTHIQNVAFFIRSGR
jgi:hypothetical protein